MRRTFVLWDAKLKQRAMPGKLPGCIPTLARGGMYWEIHPPRPERFPEGEAREQSRGPRGAKSPPEGNLEGRGGCIFQCIPTRGSVRTFFHHYQGSIDFLVWQQMALLSVMFCLKKNLLICNYTLFTNIKCLFFAQYTAVIIIWEWGNWYLSILHKGSTFMRGGPLHRLVSQRSARGRETNQPVWWIRALVG